MSASAVCSATSAVQEAADGVQAEAVTSRWEGEGETELQDLAVAGEEIVA